MAAVSEDRVFQYDKRELAKIARAFKAMDEEAQKAARREVNALAQYAMDRIRAKASSLDDRVAERVAAGGRVSATSKIGELRFGFAAQRFSGGADTAFNNNRIRRRSSGNYIGYRQFPPRTARVGVRGNEGRFIYPALRESQKYIIATWEDAFFRILKEFGK